jgi:hypothetical protein
MNKLPFISSYGNYSSDNYGAHCLKVEINNVIVWFSYKTPIAFKINDTFVIRENDWNVTTGKHLNAIDRDKKKRVDSKTFEKLYFELAGLTINE